MLFNRRARCALYGTWQTWHTTAVAYIQPVSLGKLLAFVVVRYQLYTIICIHSGPDLSTWNFYSPFVRFIVTRFLDINIYVRRQNNTHDLQKRLQLYPQLWEIGIFRLSPARPYGSFSLRECNLRVRDYSLRHFCTRHYRAAIHQHIWSFVQHPTLRSVLL